MPLPSSLCGPRGDGMVAWQLETLTERTVPRSLAGTRQSRSATALGPRLHSSYAHPTVHIITLSQCPIFRLFFLFFLSVIFFLFPPLFLLAALVTLRYDLMGNFVSSSCSTSSRPTTTSSPSPPTSLPLPPTPSHRKDRTTLTSALTAHATRLAHLFSLSSIRLDDIEEGLSLPADDTGSRGPHADADSDLPNGRQRALLIGIAYNGELSNTHKDVDRYRDMLLGTPSLFCFYRFLFSPLALLSLTSFIVSLLLFLFLLHPLTLTQARMGTAWRTSWCSRMTLLCPATSSRPVRTSSVHPFLFLCRSPDFCGVVAARVAASGGRRGAR